MVSLRGFLLALNCCILISITCGLKLKTQEKLKRLRAKHKNIYKDFIREKHNGTTLDIIGNAPIENNTKREYVYYPEEGGHRRHMHGHFHGFHHFHDMGGYGGGGDGGGDGDGDGCCDGCSCGGEQEETPEYTHTHHVVRYHHHVGEFSHLLLAKLTHVTASMSRQ